MNYSDAHISSQRRATKAVVKFCQDHGYDVQGVDYLQACLKALEKRDVRSAVEAYLRVPLGRMGCFDDWLPPVVFSHENPEYARAVFEALITQWNLLMQLSMNKEPE